MSLPLAIIITKPCARIQSIDAKPKFQIDIFEWVKRYGRQWDFFSTIMSLKAWCRNWNVIKFEFVIIFKQFNKFTTVKNCNIYVFYDLRSWYCSVNHSHVINDVWLVIVVLKGFCTIYKRYRYKINRIKIKRVVKWGKWCIKCSLINLWHWKYQKVIADKGI